MREYRKEIKRKDKGKTKNNKNDKKIAQYFKKKELTFKSSINSKMQMLVRAMNKKKILPAIITLHAKEAVAKK
jgi:hypothetical protein